MLYITRREHFSASHTLRNDSLSETENEKLFGKCNSFHGHNYYLEITIKGEVDPVSGYVMDLKKLKYLIEDEVVVHLDHKNLNTDVCTCEKELDPRLAAFRQFLKK